MANTGGISADRLKSFIERIERLEEERRAIGSDIKDVYSEAKGVGFDVRTMRKIISLRRMDVADRDEQEALVECYAHALGMVIGGTGLNIPTVTREPTEDELVEKAGRIIGEVDRCMALAADRAAPKIEAIKSLIGCSTGKAHKLRGMVAERLAQFSRISAGGRENENATMQELTDISQQHGMYQGIETKEEAISGVHAGGPSEPSDPAEQSVNSSPLPVRVSHTFDGGEGRQSGTYLHATGRDPGEEGDDDGHVLSDEEHRLRGSDSADVGSGDRDGEPVEHDGRQPAAASGNAGPDGNPSGQVLPAPGADEREEPGRCAAGTAAGHAGGAPLHGGYDRRGDRSTGDHLRPPAGPAVDEPPPVIAMPPFLRRTRQREAV